MVTFAYMIKTNFHTHSLFCDGQAAIEDFVKEAIANGFTKIGFSGHAPMTFHNKFAIKQESLNAYCENVRRMLQKYKDQIEIYLGLEADYIPNVTTPFEEFKDACGLNYIIGAVHLVINEHSDDLWFIDGPDVAVYDSGLNMFFNNDARAAVEAYFHQVIEMIKHEKPDIIGHMDKIKMHNNERFFSTSDSWYRNLMVGALEAAHSINAVVEVNPRGLYKGRCDDLFPGKEWLPVMKEMGLKVMLNSDAHHPDDLMKEYYTSLDAVRKAGYEAVAVLGENGIEEVEI